MALPALSQTNTTTTGGTLPAVRVQGSADTGDYKADTVSSPKFTQPLVDTPQTITVIKKEILQEQGATTLVEALRNTPGITMTLGENGNTNTKDNIFLRGFDATGSIFVDGIRQLGSFPRDIYNTEQIEVIKGPSGSEYGRVSASGSINLSSKTPRLENFLAGTATTGTDEQARLTVDVNRTIGETSALRLNLLTQDSGVAGRDYVRNKGWAFAPSLALGLNTPTRVIFSYEHVDQDNRPDGGIPTIGLSGFIGTGTQIGAPAVDTSNYYGSINDFQRITGDAFTARIEHDLDADTTIRNTTYIGRTEQLQIIGSVANPAAQPLPYSSWTVARSRHHREQSNALFTNQTNLSTKLKLGGLEHAVSTGVEFIYEKQNTPTLAGNVAGTVPAANVYAPVPTSPSNAGLARTGVYSKGDTSTVAAYLFDTLKLSEQWQVNGGLRLDRYNVSNDSVAAAGGPVTQIKGQDTLVTYKFGALYKPAPNGSIYAGYSLSQRPPGGENFQLNAGATNVNNPNLDPQEARNIELGTKWDLFDNKLALTAAIFRSENKNDLAQVDAVTGDVTQYGKRIVQGIELGSVGQITPAWSVSAGVSLLDTEIKQGTAAQNGAALQWTPRVAFTSWTTYKFPMGLTVGGGVRYVDTVARSATAAQQAPGTATFAEVPDYWVADAMASYAVHKNVSLQLNVYNLFDKKYIATINNNGARYTPGTPRSALVSANFKF